MKTKLFYLLSMYLFVALMVTASAQTQTFTNVRIDGNLGLGDSPQSNSKLYLYRNNTSTLGNLYGLYFTQTTSSSSGNLYGAYFSTGNSSSSSTGSVFGVYADNSKHSSGTLYGGYFNNVNLHSSTTNPIYGVYSFCNTASPNNTVYGIYSQVTGHGSAKKWAGYFTGGDMYVSGNIGIGTTDPQYKLDITGKACVNVPSSNNPIDAFTIDVVSFQTPTNAANSYFLRMRDIGNNNATFIVRGDGNVGIGVPNPTVKLDVAGIIRAHEVKVCINQGCDYVFEEDYNLMSLTDLSSFIKTNKHLPEVAPAAQMETEGINLSDMNMLLLKKVEELTLYVIELKNEIDNLKK